MSSLAALALLLCHSRFGASFVLGFSFSPPRREGLFFHEHADKTTLFLSDSDFEELKVLKQHDRLDRNGVKSVGQSSADTGVVGTLLVDKSLKAQQLWLDLRDTAFFPHEAMGFLEEQCSANACSIVDGVLVSSSMFDKIVQNRSTATGTTIDHGQKFGLMYLAGDSLIGDSATKQMSIPIGTRIEIELDDESKRTVDPLQALDVCFDQKDWLFLDAPRKLRSSQQADSRVLSQITSLLQFLSASASLTNDGGALNSVDLLVHSRRKNSSESANDTRGGIAISCIDRDTFFRVGAALAEFRGSQKLTTTTESGLLVPSDQLCDEGSESQLPRTALVLPLDLRIWESALDLNDLNDSM